MPLWYHKVDDYKWIHGSIRQDLEPDERSVWADLLAMAGMTREPRRGYIERSKGIPYPKKVLVCMLNITDELFDRTVSKCAKEGRLKIFDDGTMRITNWERYNNVKEWHDKKEKERESKKAKQLSIEKAKKSRTTLDNNVQGMTRSINELNGNLKKLENKMDNTTER